MLRSGTAGKLKLRAVDPGNRRALIESYATWDAVAARRAALQQAGYPVLVTVNEGVIKGQDDGNQIALSIQ